MREILFRGKRIDNGEWVYGDICHHDGVVSYIGQHPADGSMVCYDIESETVGQFTGLTDKNGKRIFEGDIVKTDKFGEPNKWYIIKFDLQLGAFIGEEARHNMYFTTFDGDSELFEVIGDIYDNPELLEVRE